MRKNAQSIVTEYARMWPREVLYLPVDLLKDVRQRLNQSGVYVLYKDEHPYYVGRADHLYKRLMWHADNPKATHFHFWNFFSVYVTTKHSEVEGILITSMPTANRQKPKIKRIALPAKAWQAIRDKRRPQFRDSDASSKSKQRGLTRR